MKLFTPSVSGRIGIDAATLALLVAICSTIVVVQAQEGPADSPEITIGERLFLETRFAKFFPQFVSGGAGVEPHGFTAVVPFETSAEPAEACPPSPRLRRTPAVHSSTA